jgi:hypothetical protein
MGGKIKNKKELTLSDIAGSISDLAGAVKNGFDEVYERMDGVESRLGGRIDGLENRLAKNEDGLYNLCKQVGNLTGEVNKIKVGQEELKDIVSGIYHVEIRDLKSRVEVLEKKAGI